MLHVHDRLGDFEIIHLLGKGGMGEVYEARQFNPDRRVALKVLAPWLADDDDAYQRFCREAAVPAKLDHPGIVRIITQGKTDAGVAYYTMHLVRGISLAAMIKRSSVTPHSEAATRTVEVAATPSMEPPPTSAEAPPLSPNIALESSPQLLRDYRTDRFTTLARIGVQVARALAYAHQQGHVHRDIKPSNVMVDHHDHVYLVDFGLTRALEAAAGSGTQAGVVIGTPWYMSPEQAEGKPVDARCDIYSLGITLYELATQGLGPWTANRDDKHSVMAQVRAGLALPLRTLAPGIPPALEHIIVRAMNLRPNKRYETAAELAKDLEAFLGIQSKHTPNMPKRMPDAAPPRWGRRAGVVVALALVVTAIAITAVAIANRRNPDEKKDAEQPATVKSKLDGKNAFPNVLRQHPLGVKMSLVKENVNEPLWNDPLFGNGSYIPKPQNLTLVARDNGVYMMAIADPDRSNFDFSVDVGKIHPVTQKANRLGIVFGWRKHLVEPDTHPRYFIVELDEHALGVEGIGNLKTGTGWLVSPNDKNRAAGGEWFTLLPNEMGLAPLRKPQVSYHKIHLKVRGETAIISADDGPPNEFSLAQIRKTDPRAAEKLDPRGVVGLWVRDGAGTFINPSITLFE